MQRVRGPSWPLLIIIQKKNCYSVGRVFLTNKNIVRRLCGAVRMFVSCPRHFPYENVFLDNLLRFIDYSEWRRLTGPASLMSTRRSLGGYALLRMRASPEHLLMSHSGDALVTLQNATLTCIPMHITIICINLTGKTPAPKYITKKLRTVAQTQQYYT